MRRTMPPTALRESAYYTRGPAAASGQPPPRAPGILHARAITIIAFVRMPAAGARFDDISGGWLEERKFLGLWWAQRARGRVAARLGTFARAVLMNLLVVFGKMVLGFYDGSGGDFSIFLWVATENVAV